MWDIDDVQNFRGKSYTHKDVIYGTIKESHQGDPTIGTANHLLFRNPPLHVARNFYNLNGFQWILQNVFSSEKLQCKAARLLTLLLNPDPEGLLEYHTGSRLGNKSTALVDICPLWPTCIVLR